MKKVIIILFLIIAMAFCPFSYAKEFDEITLEGAFSECLKKSNTEDDIKKYLEIEPIYVNLKDCLDIALFYNLLLKISNYEYIESKWDYKNALSNFLPELGASAYMIYYSGQVLVGAALVDKFHELALSVNLHASHSLTKGGEDIFEALAKRQVKFSKQYGYNFTYDEVLLNTTRAYWELLQTKLNIEIYRKNHAERCAQLVLTQNLLDSGLGTKFDVIRAQTELAQAKQNLLNSMQEFRLRQAKLSNILGIEITSALMPIELEAVEQNLVANNKTIETLFNEAKFKRQDVKQIEAEIRALKNEKRKIYTQFAPRPRVYAQQQWQGTADFGIAPATVISGYLDWNIGKNSGMGTITEARKKQAEIEKRITELEQKLRDIKEDLVKSFYEAKVSKDRIVISKEQVEYAKESVNLAELRLDSGEGIMIDVIQAQTFKTTTKIELLNSIIRYNLAQVQILFDSGAINKEIILKDYSP